MENKRPLKDNVEAENSMMNLLHKKQKVHGYVNYHQILYYPWCLILVLMLFQTRFTIGWTYSITDSHLSKLGPRKY